MRIQYITMYIIFYIIIYILTVSFSCFPVIEVLWGLLGVFYGLLAIAVGEAGGAEVAEGKAASDQAFGLCFQAISAPFFFFFFWPPCFFSMRWQQRNIKEAAARRVFDLRNLLTGFCVWKERPPYRHYHPPHQK